MYSGLRRGLIVLHQGHGVNKQLNLTTARFKKSTKEEMVERGHVVPSDNFKDPFVVELALLYGLDQFGMYIQVCLHLTFRALSLRLLPILRVEEGLATVVQLHLNPLDCAQVVS